MLVSMKEVLEIAEKEGTAIGAFNVPNWESAAAITQASEETMRPVIFNWAPVHSTLMGMEDAAEIMLYFARKAKTPIAVNLDHGDSFERCVKAIRLGFTSVMIDASSLSYDGNVELTRRVVEMAHAAGVSVEAEVGHIFTSLMGVEGHNSTVESAADFKSVDDVYTQPDMALDFKEKTGADALAVAFGTSHGIYVKKPCLDLNRVKEIRAKVNMPLVMHGGSGLSREEFQTAIRNGIRKINYYTYMTLAGGKAVKSAMDKTSAESNIFFHDIPLIAQETMAQNVKEAIQIFALK